MFVKELSCPYCGAKQNPHGFGQLERVNERNCQACGKPFVFTVAVHYQTFIEVDFSEPPTGETSAVNTLKKVIEDAPKDEKKAHISAEIMTVIAEHCRGYGKKQALVERFSAKTGYSVSKITNMLSGSSMMDERVATILSISIEKSFYIETAKTKRGEHHHQWRIGNQAETEAKPEETEIQASSHQQNHIPDGMTTFEYVFGYNVIKETRKIDPADIPAYLIKLSEKKDHRDVVTGKPKHWELLKINGLPVKKEDAA